MFSPTVKRDRDQEGSTGSRPVDRPWSLRRMLPFAVAVLLVAFVFSRLDLGVFVAELAKLNYAAYFALVFILAMALLAADTYATGPVYRRVAPKLRFVDLFVLRGASYLPGIVNHHLGQAFVTYAVARRYGKGLL